MSHKISKLMHWLLPILIVILCPVALRAQNATQEKQTTGNAAHTQTVTGCLQKGDEPGEFAIVGADGKTWELRSANVKLDQHLGHKVTVTGSVTHESKAEEKREGQVEKAATKEAYSDLNVTSLKMVSDSCGK
jgi:hypothetical protein